MLKNTFLLMTKNSHLEVLESGKILLSEI